MEQVLKRLIRMSVDKNQNRGWLPLAMAIAIGLFPAGIRAFDPFSLQARSHAPQKPRYYTYVAPGEDSSIAQHSCKDPSRIKLALRRHGHSVGLGR